MHTFLRTTIYGLIAVSSLIFGTQARANEAVPGEKLETKQTESKKCCQQHDHAGMAGDKNMPCCSKTAEEQSKTGNHMQQGHTQHGMPMSVNHMDHSKMHIPASTLSGQ